MAKSRAFWIAVAAVVLQFLLVYLSQFTAWGQVYPVTRKGLGGDFHAYFVGAQDLARGGRIYDTPYIVAPALVVVLVSALADFSEATAFSIYQLCILVTVSAVIWACCRALAADWRVGVAIFVVIIISHPFQFLFDRGNLDAFNIGAALAAIILAFHGKQWWAALIFAVAVNLKTNALIFFPALLRSSRIAVVAFTLFLSFAFILFVMLLTPEGSARWIELGIERMLWGTVSLENASLYRLYRDIPYGMVVASLVLLSCALPVFTGIVRSSSTKRLEDKVESFLLILPLYAAFPPLNFPYAHTFLPLTLLLYCHEPSSRGWVKAARAIGISGVVLSTFPASFLFNSFPNALAWPSLVAAGGLQCLLVANALLVMAIDRGGTKDQRSEDIESTESSGGSQRLAGAEPLLVSIIVALGLLIIARDLINGNERILFYPPHPSAVISP